MILINGEPGSRINAQDRGLQYGDGVFETLAYRDGQLEFFNAHLGRLMLGCQRLNITFDLNQQSLLKAEVQTLCAQQSDDAVIKIIVTRGVGGRGYRYSDAVQATRIVSGHPMPDYPAHYAQGITVRLCHHKLPHNPILAGIKHLNRLDQVIARNEWQEDAITEGLMQDAHGFFIEGTMTNLFMVKQNTLLTPQLSLAGVAGILRSQLLDLAKVLNIEVEEVDIIETMLRDADEVFLCNSLVGIWPVTLLQDWQQRWPIGPFTQRLQHALKLANKS